MPLLLLVDSTSHAPVPDSSEAVRAPGVAAEAAAAATAPDPVAQVRAEDEWQWRPISASDCETAHRLGIDLGALKALLIRRGALLAQPGESGDPARCTRSDVLCELIHADVCDAAEAARRPPQSFPAASHWGVVLALLFAADAWCCMHRGKQGTADRRTLYPLILRLVSAGDLERAAVAADARTKRTGAASQSGPAPPVGGARERRLRSDSRNAGGGAGASASGAPPSSAAPTNRQ